MYITGVLTCKDREDCQDTVLQTLMMKDKNSKYNDKPAACAAA